MLDEESVSAFGYESAAGSIHLYLHCRRSGHVDWYGGGDEPVDCADHEQRLGGGEVVVDRLGGDESYFGNGRGGEVEWYGGRLRHHNLPHVCRGDVMGNALRLCDDHLFDCRFREVRRHLVCLRDVDILERRGGDVRGRGDVVDSGGGDVGRLGHVFGIEVSLRQVSR